MTEPRMPSSLRIITAAVIMWRIIWTAVPITLLVLAWRTL